MGLNDLLSLESTDFREWDCNRTTPSQLTCTVPKLTSAFLRFQSNKYNNNSYNTFFKGDAKLMTEFRDSN